MTTYVKVLCKCAECKRRYTGWWPKDSEDNPPCTFCHPPEPWTPQPFAIGNVARQKAMKMAMEVAEAQGFTDMKDNLRPGDTAVKLTAAQSKMADDAELLTKAANGTTLTTHQKNLVRNFWGGNRIGSGVGSQPMANVIQSAVAGARQAKAEGSNPLQILQGGIKAGRLPDPTNLRAARTRRA